MPFFSINLNRLSGRKKTPVSKTPKKSKSPISSSDESPLRTAVPGTKEDVKEPEEVEGKETMMEEDQNGNQAEEGIASTKYLRGSASDDVNDVTRGGQKVDDATTAAEEVEEEDQRSERVKPPSPPPHYPVVLQLRPASHHPRPGSGRRKPRPITARLEKPKVLNETLRSQVDMSELTRDMVKKMPKPITNPSISAPSINTTNTTTTTSSDYSSGDYTSTSSSPLGVNNKQSGDDDDRSIVSSASGGDSETEGGGKKPLRPGTTKLVRPSRHISVPTIIPTPAAKAPLRRTASTTTAIIKSFPPKQRRRNLEQAGSDGGGPGGENPKPNHNHFTGQDKEKHGGIPQPCLTCGKEQNPERFHSHPVHTNKLRVKDRDRTLRDTHHRHPVVNKRIVTKPLPLMYKSSKKVVGKIDGLNHSKSPSNDGNRTSITQSEESLAQLDAPHRRRLHPPLATRSADNSPTRITIGKTRNHLGGDSGAVSEPEESASKSLPLSRFIKQSKASMHRNLSTEDEYTVAFFEKEAKRDRGAEESPFHNPFRNKPGGGGVGINVNKPPVGKTHGTFGGTKHSNRNMNRQNSVGRGREQANVLRRPSLLDERPVEEPSDDEELDDIVVSKPLDDVPEHSPIANSPKGTAQRRMNAIKEESSSSSRPGTSTHSQLLTCYICGREFGTRSLPIHEPKCIEKWERDNAALPPELRRATPQRPTHPLTRDEWNEYAWTTAQAQLVPCWCGRTFFPERLAVHQKGCKPPPGKDTKRPGSTTRTYDVPASAILGSAKPTVSCYICGREFGTRSIAIHEPQCLNKWRAVNSDLPPQMQRPEPRKPQILYDEHGNIDRAAMEDAAWQSHLDTLVKCPTCPRTFLPDRLAKHQRACRGALE